MLGGPMEGTPSAARPKPDADPARDAYFSADVETDGPIPGEFSMLSFALVYAGSFDGARFLRPERFELHFTRELRPISANFQPEALKVNGLHRDRLQHSGLAPDEAMRAASRWVKETAGDATPILVAYPLSFDWAWLYWYFIKYSGESPFSYSHCFDLKTAVAIKLGIPVASASRKNLPEAFRAQAHHTHRALDDAREQAEIFGKVFAWKQQNGSNC